MKKSLTLSQKIKKARRQAGLSQKQLGSALQLSDKAISSYEVGRATPTVETLQQISSLTKQPLHFFLSGAQPTNAELLTALEQIGQELAVVRRLLEERDE